tara:strand:- start:452 stop:1744 length:1293 start_codon:yes stop_codon:yes gene_type:complete
VSLLLINGKKTNNSKIDILISKNKITKINPEKKNADKIIDLKGKYILPGIIDPHVHMRDMEQANKEDWVSGTSAAMRGGITTVIDMPNTIPPTINLKNLNIKRKFASKSNVNFGFNMGFIGTNCDDLKSAGKFNAIKVFLCESSGGFPVENPELLNKVFQVAQEIEVPLIFHSESGTCIQECMKEYEPQIKNHHLIRNRKCAIRTTTKIIELSEKYDTIVYLAHVATAEEIELIKEAKKTNKKIFCEVTPHHLLITRNVLDKVENWGRVNPPLRDYKDNDRIYEALLDGTVDTIGTDHAPHQLSEKNEVYAKAPSGFPGFETCMPLLLNEVNKGNLELELVEKVTSKNSAKIFNLKDRGYIKIGYFADLVVLDMDKKLKVNPNNFLTKAKYSPFIDMNLKGDIYMTIVNGQIGYYENKIKQTKGIELDYC